ncbi:MAG: TlpA disulfide reductase family protein [Reichenbachiella sp.]|uniref:TlpA family protein disulfide reductase n=1 Tax=Reichenbachiella sp. TaxID=2184521 RepID=UPI003298B060
MKKFLSDWWLIIALVVMFYLFGYAEVVGFMQRLVLSTGIIQTETIDAKDQQIADYNFRLIGEQGNIVDFNRFKGQTVFLNFWATWCPPCVAEMPDIHDLYEKVKNENVAFVLISQDENFDKAKNFLDRKSYSFPVYQLASSLPKIFSSRSIPTTFVISPEGKIIAKHTGMAKYDTEAFRQLLVAD